MSNIRGQVPTTNLGDITARALTLWIKQLRRCYAASTVAGILTVFSMMLDDAVDEHLIASDPILAVRRRARRGRRRNTEPMPAERIWATPEQVVRIADQTALLGTHSDWLLVITTGWTGARWGEMTGLHRTNTRLDDGCIVINPDTGCLHESTHGMWLGPTKTPASARTITLPPFLITLLRAHLDTTDSEFVFTSQRGCWLRRSDFDRRIFRPAIDGNLHQHNPAVRTYPVQPSPDLSYGCRPGLRPRPVAVAGAPSGVRDGQDGPLSIGCRRVPLPGGGPVCS